MDEAADESPNGPAYTIPHDKADIPIIPRNDNGLKLPAHIVSMSATHLGCVEAKNGKPEVEPSPLPDTRHDPGVGCPAPHVVDSERGTDGNGCLIVPATGGENFDTESEKDGFAANVHTNLLLPANG